VDLRQYFRKIREAEASLTDEYPIVSSLETSDGGKAGIVSEVPRSIAARMIVEGRAVIATEAERELYRQEQLDGKARAEKAELAKRVQVAFIADPVANCGPNRKANGPLGK
jgi:hypothetical protein